MILKTDRLEAGDGRWIARTQTIRRPVSIGTQIQTKIQRRRNALHNVDLAVNIPFALFNWSRIKPCDYDIFVAPLSVVQDAAVQAELSTRINIGSGNAIARESWLFPGSVGRETHAQVVAIGNAPFKVVVNPSPARSFFERSCFWG